MCGSDFIISYLFPNNRYNRYNEESGEDGGFLAVGVQKCEVYKKFIKKEGKSLDKIEI